jgi:hypothetical protein
MFRFEVLLPRAGARWVPRGFDRPGDLLFINAWHKLTINAIEW